jgi:hypothetical protein
MATTWIHRAHACDLLIQFTDHTFFRNSWRFGADYLEYISTDDDRAEITYYFPDFIGDIAPIGYTTSEQVLCYMGLDAPLPQLSGESFSSNGYAIVSMEEALTLGKYGIPEGFIPGEIDGVWRREERTVEELDQELDEYNQDGEEQKIVEMWNTIHESEQIYSEVHDC